MLSRLAIYVTLTTKLLELLFSAAYCML